MKLFLVVIAVTPFGLLIGGLFWLRSKGWLHYLKHPLGMFAAVIAVAAIALLDQTFENMKIGRAASSTLMGLSLYGLGILTLEPGGAFIQRLFRPQYRVVGFRPRSPKAGTWVKLNYYTVLGRGGEFREGKQGPATLDPATFNRLVSSGGITPLSPPLRMNEQQSLFVKPNGEIVLAARLHPTEHRCKVVGRLPTTAEPAEQPAPTQA